ncbi:hypothetical protein [Microbacterium sp. RG1]|uniref:hypothetical protein n=1 Tax=Microbacterium sp. RG1 TaxID=2489212 RepID=UPI0010CA55CE|nr:hypothetical protein [Microbacterium sp. RG1]QCQ16678.1 hypothetical protein EHF32_08070 [Microbacterium sp. RG1]
MVTFHVVLAFVILSTVAAFVIGWCLPIGRFASDHIAPAFGVMGRLAWSRRASWFNLLFAGLGMQGIALAAALYRVHADDLGAGFARSPVVFSSGVAAIALALLMLWAGVPLRASLQRRLSGASATAIALCTPLALTLVAILCVCLTLVPR